MVLVWSRSDWRFSSYGCFNVWPWNSRSRSCPKSKVMTHSYARRPTDSYGLGFVSIGPTVPELWPFENLTLRFWGQGQGQSLMVFFRTLGQRCHVVLVLCRSAGRLPRYRGGQTRAHTHTHANRQIKYSTLSPSGWTVKNKTKNTKRIQYPPLQTSFARV